MIEKKDAILTLMYHEDAINPADPKEYEDQWRVYSFSTKHSNFKHPIKEFGLGPDGSCSDPVLREKLDSGLAFLLSYFEHGACSWFLYQQWPCGTEIDKRWDGVELAGLAVWDSDEDHLGAKSYEDRAKDLAELLKAYTCWCNGECYGYSLDELDGSEEETLEIESCFGYFGVEQDLKDMFDAIREAAEGYDIVKVTGPAAWLADHYSL